MIEFYLFIFYFDRKKIESIDNDGIRKLGVSGPLFGNHKMYGMTATTDKCPIFYTQCLHNGECPDNKICLNNQNAPSGRSCKCITGAKCEDLMLPMRGGGGVGSGH